MNMKHAYFRMFSLPGHSYWQWGVCPIILARGIAFVIKGNAPGERMWWSFSPRPSTFTRLQFIFYSSPLLRIWEWTLQKSEPCLSSLFRKRIHNVSICMGKSIFYFFYTSSHAWQRLSAVFYEIRHILYAWVSERICNRGSIKKSLAQGLGLYTLKVKDSWLYRNDMWKKFLILEAPLD